MFQNLKHSPKISVLRTVLARAALGRPDPFFGTEMGSLEWLGCVEEGTQQLTMPTDLLANNTSLSMDIDRSTLVFYYFGIFDDEVSP